jgi:hypothetical protein
VVLAAGAVGIVYIIGRTIGKFAGAYAGASFVKSGPTVKKYLGIGLLPQSGVAIGLSIATYNTVSAVNMEAAAIIQNVILAAVLVFALTGPVLVKMAYFKAGENTVTDEKKVKTWKNTPVYQK